LDTSKSRILLSKGQDLKKRNEFEFSNTKAKDNEHDYKFYDSQDSISNASSLKNDLKNRGTTISKFSDDKKKKILEQERDRIESDFRVRDKTITKPRESVKLPCKAIITKETYARGKRLLYLDVGYEVQVQKLIEESGIAEISYNGDTGIISINDFTFK
jgi:hypothetical protein